MVHGLCYTIFGIDIAYGVRLPPSLKRLKYLKRLMVNNNVLLDVPETIMFMHVSIAALQVFLDSVLFSARSVLLVWFCPSALVLARLNVTLLVSRSSKRSISTTTKCRAWYRVFSAHVCSTRSPSLTSGMVLPGRFTVQGFDPRGSQAIGLCMRHAISALKCVVLLGGHA